MGLAFMSRQGVTVDIWHALKTTRIRLVEQHLADVNAKRDEDGMTPLHFAAASGQKEVAALLIANGALVNAKVLADWDGDGDETLQTPLDVATHPDTPDPNKNKKEIADLLQKHGGKTGEELKAEGK